MNFTIINGAFAALNLASFIQTGSYISLGFGLVCGYCAYNSWKIS